MLQELSIRNFKLFGDAGVDIRPGDVTVFVGPNGSGKSTVLQGLLVLKQSLGSSQLIPNGDAVQLGGFRDLVHGQASDREIEFKLAINYETDWPERGWLKSGTCSYRAVFTDEGLLEHEALFKGGDFALDLKFSRYGQNPPSPQLQVVPGLQATFNPQFNVGSPIQAAMFHSSGLESIAATSERDSWTGPSRAAVPRSGDSQLLRGSGPARS